MEFFRKLFGKAKSSSSPPPKPVDKVALIRMLAKKRMIQDPLAAMMGLTGNEVESMPPEVLIGLPEATLVTIVESYADLKRRGAADWQIFAAIEDFRRFAGSGAMPQPLTLDSYIAYRLQIEHSHGAPISPQHIDDCTLLARTLYRCPSA